MRRFLGAAAAGLVAGCLVGGCASSAQQPPAVIGSAPLSPAASPSAGTTSTAATAGNVGLSSGAIKAAITSANSQATALHVTGTLTLTGGTLTLDAHFNRNGPSSGTLGFEGATVPFVSTTGADYFQLTASFMSLIKMTGTSARGMWVTGTSSAGGAVVTLFSSFLTLSNFLSHGLACRGGTFTYTGLQQLGSQHVAVYQEQGDGGASFQCDYPVAGAALVLRDSGGAGDSGQTLDLTWNQPTTVAIPHASQIFSGSSK